MKKKKKGNKDLALIAAAGLLYFPIGFVLSLAKKYGAGPSRRRRK